MMAGRANAIGIRTRIAGLFRTLGGAARQRRRASVLVIAVGALALLAVIVASYALVGRTDATTARIATRSSKVDEAAAQARDYFAKVIADDALAVFLEYDENDVPVLIREAWDYPRTSYRARSFTRQSGQIDETQWEIAFTPSGSLPRDIDLANDLDPAGLAPFDGSDPWLASTEPVFLNPAGDPWTDPDYLDRRDWLHISNVAPDGRFVNLFNLRNNFNAEPGIGLDDNGRGRMSAGLALFRNENELYNQSINNSEITNSELDFENSVAANLLNPAHWDSRQQFLFRPAKNGRFGPDSPRFLPYQFADADGDGFYDARWVELVRVADPLASSNNLQADWILPRDGDWRWFFGVRIVDLSSLVNVNTATDITGTANAPGDAGGTGSERYPAGVSPADVDLRQVLTMASPFDQYQEALVNQDQQDKLPESLVGTPVDYFDRGLDDAVALDAGAEGYADLRQTIADGVVPPPNVADYGGIGGGGGGGPDEPILNAEGRYTHYRDRAAVFGEAVLDDSGASPSLATGGLFGLGDLADLLTYHGRNDDSATSRLERAVDGRVFGQGQNLDWFGPLRSNRPLLIERGLVDTWENDGLGDFLSDPDDLLLYNTDVRRLLTTVSGAAKRRSWTYGPLDPSAGGGPPMIALQDFLGLPTQITEGGIRSFTIPNDNLLGPDVLADGPLPARAALTLASPDTDPGPEEMEARTRPLFKAYVDALAPFLKVRTGAQDMWHDGTMPQPTDTLFYGNHPMRALLAAAHMTANAVDMFDNDEVLPDNAPTDGPAAYTLNLTNDAPTGQTIEFPFTRLSLLPKQLAEVNTDLLLDAGQDGAVNIFGVETQPFLTEAASYFIYTDAPHDGVTSYEAGPADEDNMPIDVGDFQQEIPKITIWPDVDPDSDDFLAQILAFQLTNPFDQELTLDDFYLQYAGFRFNFPTGTILPPNDSIAAWAIGEDTIEQLSALGLTQEEFESDIEDLIAGSAAQPMTAVELEIAAQDIYGGSVDPAWIDFTDTGSVQPGDEHLLRMALLWRNIGDQGVQTDDLLVDRLRQPDVSTDPVLDARLPGTDAFKITGTNGLQDNPVPDDYGYSFARWAYIRRPSDPGATLPPGALPAYSVEKRWEAVSLNASATEEASPADGDFTGGEANFSEELDTLLSKFDGAGITSGPELHIKADDKTSNPMPPNNDGLGYSVLYPEAHLDNDEFFDGGAMDPVDRFRAGDMLLPLGVGPMEDPAWSPSGSSASGDAGIDFDREWTTLGESLAMALNYDDVTIGTFPPPTPSLFENLHEHVDRGQLRIDRFVPYLNNADPMTYEYNQPTSFPPDPMTDDFVRGIGSPLALRVFEIFDTSPWGSILQPTYGLVNVNTAPASVLRSLPLLSPTTVMTEWWYDTSHDERSDIAAHLVAYRDKLYMQPRAMNGSPSTDPPLDYSDTTGQTGDAPSDPLIVWEDPTNEAPFDATARLWHTEVLGLREVPGFASLGEVALVRDRRQPATGAYPAPHDMDRLALDGATNADSDGVDSIQYGMGAADDGIPDDYDEQLTIANALAGAASVRSDLYAVWFVMHGYRRGDVEDLGASDVLRPSVARRYLMVVDRSNVLREGDKPRILLIREVPM